MNGNYYYDTDDELLSDDDIYSDILNIIANDAELEEATRWYGILLHFLQKADKQIELNKQRELTEEDFYPPPDNRTREVYIEDIDGGDTYQEYLSYFYSMYEDELWDDNLYT